MELVQSALFSLLSSLCCINEFYYISKFQLVTFLLAISGAISQFPIGKLSDRFDRRLVNSYSTFGAAFFALFAIISFKTNVFTW